MGSMNNASPKILETLTLFSSLIGIGFLIWGLVEIPWDDISNAGKIFYIISGILMIIVVILILVLLCLSIGNKFGTKKNGFAKCLCITLLIFNILSIIAAVISEIIIFSNMADEDDKYLDDNNYYYHNRRRWRRKYSRAEWASAVCSLTALEIVVGLNILFVSFLLKLANAKINTSYKEYLDTQIKNNNSSYVNDLNNGNNLAINVYNSPPNGNRNQNMLTFIGYDKEGHPIYSGVNQYFTQNNTVNKTNIDNGAKK